jgi:hypothetical protein
MLAVAVIPEFFVLLAGSGLVLFRRQLGSVAWMAVGALAMLVVVLVTDTVWRRYLVHLLTGDPDEGWRVVLQWKTPIRPAGLVAEAARGATAGGRAG